MGRWESESHFSLRIGQVDLANLSLVFTGPAPEPDLIRGSPPHCLPAKHGCVQSHKAQSGQEDELANYKEPYVLPTSRPPEISVALMAVTC